MKMLLIAFTLIASQASFAQSQTFTNDDLNLYMYKQAAVLALRSVDKTLCISNREFSWNITDEIDRSDKVVVSDGTQPLLIFDNYAKRFDYEGAPIGLVRVTLTTTLDYQTVTSVLVQSFTSANANTGDLKNPVIVDGWKVAAKLTCRL